jgi:hypothetical protein
LTWSVPTSGERSTGGTGLRVVAVDLAGVAGRG